MGDAKSDVTNGKGDGAAFLADHDEAMRTRLQKQYLGMYGVDISGKDEWATFVENTSDFAGRSAMLGGGGYKTTIESWVRFKIDNFDKLIAPC